MAWSATTRAAREPVIAVGSRTWCPVPLEARLPLAGSARRPCRCSSTTKTHRSRWSSARSPLEFHACDVYPLLVKEVAWAYYHELFVAHPERTTAQWEEFARRFRPLPWGAASSRRWWRRRSPTRRIDSTSMPSTGRCAGAALRVSADDLHPLPRRARPRRRRVTDRPELQRRPRRVRRASCADLRVADPPRLPARLTPPVACCRLRGGWFSFFMYYASGPPPQRLRQLLALVEAGLVRFVGADTTISTDAVRGLFVVPELQPRRRDRRRRTRRRTHRCADAVSRTREPPAAHAVGARVTSSRRSWVTTPGGSSTPARSPSREPTSESCVADGTAHPRRHAVGCVHQPPGGRRARRPGDERTGVPAERCRRPLDPFRPRWPRRRRPHRRRRDVLTVGERVRVGTPFLGGNRLRAGDRPGSRDDPRPGTDPAQMEGRRRRAGRDRFGLGMGACRDGRDLAARGAPRTRSWRSPARAAERDRDGFVPVRGVRPAACRRERCAPVPGAARRSRLRACRRRRNCSRRR